MSPALESGFSTTGPPEKSIAQVFFDEIDGDNNKYTFFNSIKIPI